MALSHSLLSDSESIDEMAGVGNLLLAEQENRKATQARLEVVQARLEEQTVLVARLEERYTALQERYRTVIFFAMIIIAYFIWLVYFLLFTKLSSYTN